MSQKMSNSKKKRTPKTSKGIHGGGGKGRPLTEVEKINLVGGGLLRNASRRDAIRDQNGRLVVRSGHK